MNENEKNRIRKIYTNLALALLGLIAVYIVVSALIIKKVTIMYNIVIIVGLTVFWAIMDIVIPVKTQDFEGRTKEQMDAYKKYAAFDFLGYAGLMYFALAMQSNTSIYGALVYVVARMMKNRFKDEYEGVSEDDADEDESIVDAEGTVIDTDEEESAAVAAADQQLIDVDEEDPVTDQGSIDLDEEDPVPDPDPALDETGQ